MNFPIRPGHVPRAWQLEALGVTREALRTWQAVIVSAATGTGKATLIAAMAILLAKSGKRVLILAHRKELVRQLVETIRAVPENPGVGMVGIGANQMLNPIVVAMVQALTEKRRAQMGVFHVVMQDECHHAVAASHAVVFETIKERYAAYRNVGFTATPFRSGKDGTTSGLGKIYQAVAYKYTIDQAITAGDLVPFSAWRVHPELNPGDLSLLDCPTGKDGEFDQASLAKIVDTPERNALVAAKYLEHFPDGKTSALVFAVNVRHAVHLQEAFVDAGVCARAVWGGTSTDNEESPPVVRTMPDRDRDDIVRIHKETPHLLPVLISDDILREGFDDPGCMAILKARPTRSAVVFQQMLGRGLRTVGVPADVTDPAERRRAIAFSPKPRCLFLDFVDNGCELTAVSIEDLSDTEPEKREIRELQVGDRVQRWHHDDLGVGVVRALEVGERVTIATVRWPLTRAMPAPDPREREAPHPVGELRRVAAEDDDGDIVKIVPGVSGHQTYEIFLLPGQQMDSESAIGWYEWKGTWTVGGHRENMGRVKMHVRPEGDKWAVWSLRPPMTHAEFDAVLAREDVATRRHCTETKIGAIAWADEYLRSHGLVVTPISADWRRQPVTGRTRSLMALYGLTRETGHMTEGEGVALTDAVIAHRGVDDVLDPRLKQRREHMQGKTRGSHFRKGA